MHRQFLKLLAGALAAVAMLASHAQAGDLGDLKQRGKLIVGVKPDKPPFGYRTPQGDLAGIEADLAADIASRLGLKLELVPLVTGPTRIQFLQQGKIDITIAALSVTPEREKAVDIIKPYYYASGYSLMAQKGAGLTSWPDIKGRSICGVQGAYYNRLIEEQFGAQVQIFAGQAEAIATLKQGKCIGFVYDDSALAGALMEAGMSDYRIPFESQDELPWGIAIKQGMPELSAFLSKTVEDWARKGFIQRLEDKYKLPHSRYAEAMKKKYAN